MTNTYHFLIIPSSLIVHFPKIAIRCPHEPQHLLPNTRWQGVMITVLNQVVPVIVLQVSRNGSITVCMHNPNPRIQLSPLPEQNDILLHHLYDVQMFSHHIQYGTTTAAANAISTTLDGNLHQPLQSLFKTEKLIMKLSDLKMHMIHMYNNSCCMFNGLFAARDHCPFCKHAWRN